VEVRASTVVEGLVAARPLGRSGDGDAMDVVDVAVSNNLRQS